MKQVYYMKQKQIAIILGIAAALGILVLLTSLLRKKKAYYVSLRDLSPEETDNELESEELQEDDLTLEELQF